MLLQILLAACGQGLSTAALQLPVPFLDQLLIAAVGWRLRWLLLLSERGAAGREGAGCIGCMQLTRLAPRGLRRAANYINH